MTMKKLIYSLTTLVITIVMMSACTRNNGDIGPYYGMWHVEEIRCNNADCTQNYGGYYFAFQSAVFQIKYSNPMMQEQQCTGTWSEEDGVITIEFPDARLVEFTFTGVSTDQKNHFKVEKITGKEMVLSLLSNDGFTYQYFLKKWG